MDIPKLLYVGVICVALVVALGSILPSAIEIWFDMDTSSAVWDGEEDKMLTLPMKLMPFWGLAIIAGVLLLAFKYAL